MCVEVCIFNMCGSFLFYIFDNEPKVYTKSLCACVCVQIFICLNLSPLSQGSSQNKSQTFAKKTARVFV